MKLVYGVLALMLILVAVFEANARERDFNRSRPHRRGNERSERVTQITLGEPSYGGNGCPSGTMRIVFAPDYLSFSILFDQFVAEVNEADPQRRALISCDALVPLRIPDGIQMEITRVDFRGFASLPSNANATLHSVFNFRGKGGDGERMNLRYRFDGPSANDYEISTDTLNDDGRAVQTEVSPCGGATQLRILNQIRVNSRNRSDAATVTLDSIDGTNNAVYFVNWKKCGKPR